ncbi:phytoene desaturase family protein [Agreia sp. PsM10]|uniref:phytoene desaturase family protein n=1 Tax=Agreia sp. PsM10 TaxID=3030533 RepID=UPI00345E0AF3
MVLASYAHGRGWPIPVGGSQKITDAMADDLVDHGGQAERGVVIADIAELDGFGVKIFATSATSLASITAGMMPDGYSRRLRTLSDGRGVCKVDFVLAAPIPWTNESVALSPTVHIGGSRREIANSEAEISWGRHSPTPYVLLTQPSLFDASRAPARLQTVSASIHVPNGSTRDCTADVIHQIERLAPGFRELIVGSKATPASQLAAQQRPTATRTPWRTPLPASIWHPRRRSPPPACTACLDGSRPRPPCETSFTSPHRT